ncbi:TetR/AcrR family transcriptional regulator [Nafulsella turpanensis]|uniref:TetR/AcrR family transcriptional regulator n=1 Tax=Nafulsella turpanensis TaxID=1265690 RepID=UPI00034BDECC|nr:TetR/AcrR family transcriptional regulator [Nafulsella turpanensis]
MENLLANIQIKVDEKVFLKDPETSEIGKNILRQGILLMDELGFESFTFKKLAEQIGSSEATVYRYFENKHMLLIYLISWYWNWQEYRLVFSTTNIPSAVERLKIAIRILSGTIVNDANFSHIDEVSLQRIVVAESAKSFLTKEVDADNREGFFQSYKRLCGRVTDIIIEINPDYPYPASLVSTISESAHYQRFFACHLPSLTNISEKVEGQLEEFLIDLALKTISVSE